MKTMRFFIMILFALFFIIACEPEEEIVPDLKEKSLALPFKLKARQLPFEEGDSSRFAVELNWSKIPDNSKGFIVEKSMGDSTHWKEVARLDKVTTSFKDTKTEGDSTFYYRVVSINGDQGNSFSNISFQFGSLISPPSNLIAKAGSNAIDIQWSYNSKTVDNFYILRRVEGKNEWNYIAKVSGKFRAYTDKRVEADTKYYYKVQAEFFYARSEDSNIVELFTLPKVPVNFDVLVLGKSQVEVIWEYESNNNVVLILQKSNDKKSWVSIKINSGETSYTEQNLNEKNTYYYRIYAYSLRSNLKSAYSPIKWAKMTEPLKPGSVHARNFYFMNSCVLKNVNIIGNLTVQDGTLRLVNCNITGNIIQKGDGNLEIVRDHNFEGKEARVTGNIYEYGNGSITITGAIALGHVEEYGEGSLIINKNSEIGKINRYWPENQTGPTYVVNEEGIGDISIDNSKVNAHIGEKNSGSVFILNNSESNGQVGEEENGNIIFKESNIQSFFIGEQSIGSIKIEKSTVSYGIYTYNHIFAPTNSKMGEQGSGDIIIIDSQILTHIAENGNGNIDIKENSKIGDDYRKYSQASPSFHKYNVSEADNGDAYLRDSSVIWGNISESGQGLLDLANPDNIKEGGQSSN